MGKIRNRTFVSDLHFACSKDVLSPKFNCVHFKGGYAYASNKMIAVRQPISLSNITGEENLNGVSIHMSAFAEIRKMRMVFANPEGFKCITKAGNTVIYEYQKDIVIPYFEKVIQKEGTKEPVSEIGITPSLVGLLSKSMACKTGFKFSFCGQNKAIVAEPISNEFNGEFAVLMPYMIIDTNDNF